MLLPQALLKAEVWHLQEIHSSQWCTVRFALRSPLQNTYQEWPILWHPKDNQNNTLSGERKISLTWCLKSGFLTSFWCRATITSVCISIYKECFQNTNTVSTAKQLPFTELTVIWNLEDSHLFSTGSDLPGGFKQEQDGQFGQFPKYSLLTIDSHFFLWILKKLNTFISAHKYMHICKNPNHFWNPLHFGISVGAESQELNEHFLSGKYSI